jgi:DNA-directed RNA polymerase subunit RPC12/RpoP
MRASTRRKATMQTPRRTLRVVEARGTENVVNAPPVLIASSHTIDYLCGNCGTVLLHAEDDQVHGLFIHCTQCGACNATAD